MSVGMAVSKTEVDAQLGDWARAIQKHLGDTATLKSFFDSQTDEALVALGWTEDEVAVMKTAVADGAQADLVFVGQATQTELKDSRQFIKQCWGVGSF